MSKKITIAIDGFSSCGKSTLAKQVAGKLDYIFIDSGAMYRAITYYLLTIKNVTLPVNEQAIKDLIADVDIHFEINEVTHSPEIYLNHKNINDEIRSPFISNNVSKFAAIKSVREKLVKSQQEMGKKGGIVMDGRDIGSIVFPNAELKLFITADIETRAQRRYKELKAKDIAIELDDVKKNLAERDHLDSTRKESPLIQTKDAIEIDNTNLNRTEQLELVLNIINTRLKTFC